MRFILDTALVAYLPLYSLDGASFMSRDACGHPCLAIGAGWRREGRYFDGTDDWIRLRAQDESYNTFLSFTDGVKDLPATVVAWINLNDATLSNILGKRITSGSRREWLFQLDASDRLKLVLYHYNDSATRIGRLSPALTAYEKSWICVAGTYDGQKNSSGIRLYLNGERIDNANDNSGTYTGMTPTTANIEVGSWDVGLTDLFDGLIGEVAVFNREFNPMEIQGYYVATKWRYQ